MPSNITNFDDVIDSRDVIAQIENLEGELQSAYDEKYETLQGAYDEWLHDKDSEKAD